MRLRRALRSKSIEHAPFRRDWVESGLSLGMTNAQIKRYLHTIDRRLRPEKVIKFRRPRRTRWARIVAYMKGLIGRRS